MAAFQTKGNLETRIGRTVRFSPPRDVQNKKGPRFVGTIVDEVWADPSINLAQCHRTPCKKGKHCWGDYSFFAQLIKWEEASADGKQYFVRLGYYRRQCGSKGWRFAGQTTVTDYPGKIRNLLEKTLQKKAWFRKSKG